MEKFLNLPHPDRVIIIGPSESDKSVFLTTLNLIFVNEFEKIFIYSPSLHQNIYVKKYLNVLVSIYLFTCSQIFSMRKISI